jgi:hypothetical protein
MSNILKPNLWKVALTIILFCIASALWRGYVIMRISDTFPIGFPFQFYLSWGPCPASQSCFEFNLLFLLLDVIIWYLITAFAVQWFKSRSPAA